ncbi:MAG: amidophosphoribosyltransferase [Oscillospiraceae bacterium]|jgi:amidophosphoribosyltransferase|nr:amidophosphoribosyltransferase [Oscillospiraceae bacterium]
MHEECGVFGIHSGPETKQVTYAGLSDGGPARISSAQAVYLGLFALQHRGQESCGIAVSNAGVLRAERRMGLVSESFDAHTLAGLSGENAIGHVRYSTAGGSCIENCQPIIARYAKGRLAVAHNGNLRNADALRDELAQAGALFQTTADSELIAQLIVRERMNSRSIEEAVLRAMPHFRGAYSLLVLSPRKLVAARDPLGFRPLCIGKLDGRWVFSSETCGLDTAGAEFVRDVEPGEVVLINEAGELHSFRKNCPAAGARKAVCIFEYIYFARPDSVIDGIPVHVSRMKAGELLAAQSPVEADLVIPVPDSGIEAAVGYARAGGIPYGMGFVRNNYVGRTFIKPTQSERRKSIDVKLSPMAQSVAGKRLVMIDDSIVRGSTSANIIRALKNAGAKEVHVRISSPPIIAPCYFGTDIATREELISSRLSVEEIRREIGADSLDFLRIESLPLLLDPNAEAAANACCCDACFSDEYPV